MKSRCIVNLVYQQALTLAPQVVHAYHIQKLIWICMTNADKLKSYFNDLESNLNDIPLLITLQLTF